MQITIVQPACAFVVCPVLRITSGVRRRENIIAPYTPCCYAGNYRGESQKETFGVCGAVKWSGHGDGWEELERESAVIVGAEDES